jgi:hypothetical protein
MSDIEARAAQLVAGGLAEVERHLRPAFLKAMMRLVGLALADCTNNEEAAQVHTSLGRQHLQRRLPRGFR